MNKQELAHKILDMIGEAQERVAFSTETSAVDNLIALVEAIEALCEEQARGRHE